MGNDSTLSVQCVPNGLCISGCEGLTICRLYANRKQVLQLQALRVLCVFAHKLFQLMQVCQINVHISVSRKKTLGVRCVLIQLAQLNSIHIEMGFITRLPNNLNSMRKYVLISFLSKNSFWKLCQNFRFDFFSKTKMLKQIKFYHAANLQVFQNRANIAWVLANMGVFR